MKLEKSKSIKIDMLSYKMVGECQLVYKKMFGFKVSKTQLMSIAVNQFKDLLERTIEKKINKENGY